MYPTPIFFLYMRMPRIVIRSPGAMTLARKIKETNTVILPVLQLCIVGELYTVSDNFYERIKVFGRDSLQISVSELVFPPEGQIPKKNEL